jgi:hypothetical protein
MLAQTEREERRIWSLSENRSSAGIVRVARKMSMSAA